MKNTILKIWMIIILSVLLLPGGASAQSLWDENSSGSMFLDRKGRHVNDIVTVLISEQTVTARSANKSTEYDTSIDGKVENWFTISGVVDVVKSLLGLSKSSGVPGSEVVDREAQLGTTQADTTNLPVWKLSAAHEHKGSGTMSRSDTISARITCRIVEVLPNNNFVIEGQQNLTVDKDIQTIVFKGIVRPDDINADNTVYSYNVAESEISFGGKGPIADKQRRGIFETITDIIWPF